MKHFLLFFDFRSHRSSRRLFSTHFDCTICSMISGATRELALQFEISNFSRNGSKRSKLSSTAARKNLHFFDCETHSTARSIFDFVAASNFRPDPLRTHFRTLRKLFGRSFEFRQLWINLGPVWSKNGGESIFGFDSRWGKSKDLKFVSRVDHVPVFWPVKLIRDPFRSLNALESGLTLVHLKIVC